MSENTQAKTIGILKTPNDNRVCLLPKEVKRLIFFLSQDLATRFRLKMKNTNKLEQLVQSEKVFSKSRIPLYLSTILLVKLK